MLRFMAAPTTTDRYLILDRRRAAGTEDRSGERLTCFCEIKINELVFCCTAQSPSSTRCAVESGHNSRATNQQATGHFSSAPSARTCLLPSPDICPPPLRTPPKNHHHHHVRVAGEGRRVVAPPCPRSSARLQRSPIGWVESSRSWSSHFLAPKITTSKLKYLSRSQSFTYTRA